MANQQNRNIGITVFLLVLFMVLVVSGVFYRVMQPRILNAEELQNFGAVVLEKPRIFNDFSLVDHKGDTFTLENLKDKWTLIFFGYTYCPDICPTTLATLDALYDQLSPEQQADTQVVLVSVDPGRDTVEKLAEYVPFFNEKFLGVTGDFREILKLTGYLNIAFAKVPGDPENYLVDHSGQIVLINPKGHYHGFFKAPITVERLQTTYPSIRLSSGL